MIIVLSSLVLFTPLMAGGIASLDMYDAVIPLLSLEKWKMDDFYTILPVGTSY